MLLALGSQLGRFVIEAPLGAGGMGEVYRATDSRLARTVAIKVLHSRTSSGGTARQRLEREARTVAALNHPHICTLYDVGFEGPLGYLVMEYLEGQTLASALRQGPLPHAVALTYGRQLASALDAAHGKGVIHRDLKPANLFITNGGALKVLDFGIAKTLLDVVTDGTDTVAVEATAEGTFVGTVGYAAPEQLRGEKIDHRVDLFAAGVVLAELFTGAPVFTRKSSAETIAAILNDEPPPLPPTVPGALAAAIIRCLAKDPARRFQSARALLDSLDSTDGPATGAAPAAAASAAPSIAVLPFADLSPGKDQEYFCDGMADELIAALMTIEGVRVASRSTAFQFKGLQQDISAIGQRLKVSNILEGSVRRAGDRLRVSVQLTDVAEGFLVWSERYDRGVDDVFAVQDDIARSVVDKLKVKLAGPASARIVPSASRNFEAYNLYLQGRYAVHKFTKDGLEHGMACYRRALELDPDFAEVHAELGHTYIVLAIFSVAPPRAVMPVASQSVGRALALNPNLAAGQLALAATRLWFEWHWTGAEAAYRRALELAPGDSWARYGYCTFLQLRGRHDEALAEARRAQELDPVSPLMGLGVTNALYMARRFDEALAHAEQARAHEPGFFSTYWSMALAQVGLGRHADAVATLEAGRAYSRGDATLEGFLGWAYGLAGQPEQAREVARQLEARRQAAYVGGTHIAMIYEGLGDIDTAMTWYETAYADRATDCSSYPQAPHFDTARRHPRFQELVRLIEMGGLEATT